MYSTDVLDAKVLTKQGLVNGKVVKAEKKGEREKLDDIYVCFPGATLNYPHMTLSFTNSERYLI
jgi:hypothetical protein